MPDISQWSWQREEVDRKTKEQAYAKRAAKHETHSWTTRLNTESMGACNGT